MQNWKKWSQGPWTTSRHSHHRNVGLWPVSFPSLARWLLPRSHALSTELQKTISSHPCWQNEEIWTTSNSWVTVQGADERTNEQDEGPRCSFWVISISAFLLVPSSMILIKTVPLIQGRQVSRGDGKRTGSESQELKRSTDWNCNREEIMLFGHLGAKKEMHKCRRCEKDLGNLIRYNFCMWWWGAVPALPQNSRQSSATPKWSLTE